MEPMGSQGSSASWEGQKTNVIRIFEQFQTSSPELEAAYPVPFEKLPESALCGKRVYSLFATYVATVYKIETKGNHLSIQTANNVLSSLVNQAKARFLGKASCSDSVKLFFTCLDPSASTDAAVWFKGLKKQVWRTIFERMTHAGEAMDKSAPPIYRVHVELIGCANARMGTAEAAKRQFTMLFHWITAGRSAEVSCINVKGMEWDPHFKCLVVHVPQTKTSKAKQVLAFPGANSYACVLTQFGDYMCLDEDRPPYKEHVTSWLFRHLQKNSAPGTTLGDYFRKYKFAKEGTDFYPYRVEELPEGVNAASTRAGVCNTLVQVMPLEFAVVSTGHDLMRESALHNYIDFNRAVASVGGRVLAGWDAPPWGTIGLGPQPALLLSLQDLGVDKKILDKYVDSVLNLDSASHPAYWLGGRLRPLAEAACASQIMYYKPRLEKGEMRLVLIRMREAVSKCFCDAVDPDTTLKLWSDHLGCQFKVQNLHLTAQHTSESGSVQVIEAVKTLGQSVKILSTGLTAVAESVKALKASVEEELKEIKMSLDSLEPALGEKHMRSEVDEVSSSSSGRAPKSLTPPAKNTSSPGRSVNCSSSGVVSPKSPTKQAQAPVPAHPPQQAFGSLMPQFGVVSAGTSLKGLAASKVWSQIRRGALVCDKRQDEARAKTAAKYFDAMSTPEERKMFSPPTKGDPTVEEGIKKRVLSHLNDLLVARFAAAYKEAGQEVPKALQKRGQEFPVLPVSAFEDRLKALKKLGVDLESDRVNFANFLKDFEKEMKGTD